MQEKKENKKKILKKVVKRLLLLGAIVFLLCVGTVAIYSLHILSNVSDIDTMNIRNKLSETSIMYDDEGNKLKSLNMGEDRAYATYDEIPETLVHAYVALEDKTFFDHHGFNVKRIVGAIIEAFRYKSGVGGVSTISQQLSRNIYLTQTMSERTAERKLLEAWYTIQMEQDLSKEQIMEYYLNTINLGFGTYGVKAAAKTYFNKSLEDLSIAECAALASLPQAPSNYALVQYVDSSALGDISEEDIIKNVNGGAYIINDASKERREVCLDLMRQQGYITKEEYDEAISIPLRDMLDVKFPKKNTLMSYFTDYAVSVLSDDLATNLAITQDDALDMIYSGGLRIYTTLNRESQEVIADKFDNDYNFPNISYVNYDWDENILDQSDNILFYKKSNIFADGVYYIDEDCYDVTSRGDLKIKDDSTFYYEETDTGYSLKFPKMYKWDNGHLYINDGAEIILTSDQASIKNDWLLISKEYLESDAGKSIFRIEDDEVCIYETGVNIGQSIVQPQAAMTIIENDTGHVKAMVGGRGIEGNMVYNRAVETRQPGSSIKPITVYSAALQQGVIEAKNDKTHNFINYNIDSQGVYGWGDHITAGSYVRDEPTTVDGQRWPTNANNSYYGGGTLRKALTTSTNTCAYKIWMQVGSNFSVSTAEKFGLTTIVTEGDVNDINPAALALGGMTNGVTTLEMANAYTVFPNHGTKTEKPIFYTKVVDAEGNVLIDNEKNVKEVEVLDPGVAFIMKDMMQDVVSSGTGSGAKISGTEVGGKTGTTSNQYDVWFDGFTPKYSASLWIGNDTNMPLTGMSEYAARLWGKIMEDIPDSAEGDYRKKPENVITYGGEYYVEGTI